MPRLQEEINRLFGNTRENDSSSATATWVPPVDIHEFSDRFELYVDLRGIDPAEVELTLDGGVLTLSGARREQVMTKSGAKAYSNRRLIPMLSGPWCGERRAMGIATFP